MSEDKFENEMSQYDSLKFQAEQATAKNDFDKALELYQQAIELEPNNPDALVDLGNTYNALGKFDKAENCYIETLKLDPDNWRALHNLGNLYKNIKKEYGKAIQYYEKSLKTSIKPYMPLNGIGLTYSILDNIEKAELYLQKAIDSNPNDPKLYRNLGLLLHRHKQYIKAIKLLADVHTTDQEVMQNIRYILADSNLCLENWEESIKYLVDYLTVDPNNVWAYQKRAEAYNKLKSYQKALDDYQKIRLLAPDNIACLLGMILSYNQLKDFKNQLFCLQVLSEIKPDDYEYYFRQAVTYQQLYEKDLDELNLYKSLEVLEKSKILYPDYWGNYYSQGQALLSLNQYNNALEAFEKAFSLDSRWGCILLATANTLHKLGDVERANQLEELGHKLPYFEN